MGSYGSYFPVSWNILLFSHHRYYFIMTHHYSSVIPKYAFKKKTNKMEEGWNHLDKDDPIVK